MEFPGVLYLNVNTTSEVMIQTTFLQPGSYYHIYNRGNNKENIFLNDPDYQRFLNLWAKYVEPIADSYAYCLLPNHFHFLVRIFDEEILTDSTLKFKRLTPDTISVYLSQSFSNLFNAYSKYFNIKYERTGKLFSERFKRKAVLDDSYFSALVKYIHTNPVKHNIADDFTEYPYSSYWSHILSQPTRLKKEEVLSWYGGAAFYISFHQETNLRGWESIPALTF